MNTIVELPIKAENALYKYKFSNDAEYSFADDAPNLEKFINGQWEAPVCYRNDSEEAQNRWNEIDKTGALSAGEVSLKHFSISIKRHKKPRIIQSFDGKTTLFDNWLRSVKVRIDIESKETDDAKVQADYFEWTGEHLTDDLGNLVSGYSIYRGGPNAVAPRYGTIFRMKFPIPPPEVSRPEFISRFGNPVEWVALRDGQMELAATDYIKYLLCNGFHVGLNTPLKGNLNGNNNQNETEGNNAPTN